MAQSQRVAQYISDSESDNDMELESSNNREEVKKNTKQNRRKWVPICTYNIKDDAINKIKMMVYGAKLIQILPAKENGFITDVIK